VIRNAVIHISNEQPLTADLFGVPTSADAGLLCTNLRMMDGKRPVFIDNISATFFFPYLHIRFVEIPPGSLARHLEEGGGAPGAASRPFEAGLPTVDGTAGSRLPVVVAEAPDLEDELPDPEAELEIDEDFLRRVRDI
jgi:hypothetical protein